MADGLPAESVRPEVTRLAAWAPLPVGDDERWDEEAVNRFAADIEAVTGPINTAERDTLLSLLDHSQDETVYGVLWGVLHLVETAPADGYEYRLPVQGATWIDLLRARRENYDRRTTPS